MSARAAFVSTPSLFFSLPEGPVKAGSKVLDVRTHKCFCVYLPKAISQFDRKWEAHPGFVFYDFNDPLGLDPSLHHVRAALMPLVPALPRSSLSMGNSQIVRRLSTWWSVRKSAVCQALAHDR